ncbi:MAG: glucosaminidase domain-containing protein [Hyphomicrobiaceae bacterium]|nr:glucosaminidase domain-containing protein [Hyphomicrobiaceae bacterium]
MGDIMTFRVHFLVVGAVLAAGANSAAAAELPALKATSANKVPACATPGRLMDFVASRNGAVADKFNGVATEYMRHGEALGLRWDYAFFQMLVETANLKFPGDVNAKQNNFAGLGATGGGEPGESFESVSLGVKAHLQHVLMYSGETVADPVAERTRKVQEWGVLTKWQKSISGPMTFTQLTRKWSPGDRGYWRDIASVGDTFYDKFCNIKDPRPELVAEARGTGVSVDKAGTIAATETGKQAIAEARKTGPAEINGLGAAAMAQAQPQVPPTKSSAPPAAFTVLNSAGTPQTESGAGEAQKAVAKVESKPDTETGKNEPAKSEFKLASAAGSAAAGVKAPAETAKAAAKGSCRVWQASYGGAKAVIIKAVADGLVNYTVLDVNEGREQREVAAYIAAYAKDGVTVGEFPTQGKALTKAFEICPEG